MGAIKISNLIPINVQSILLQSWGDESSQGGLMNGSLWEDKTPMDKLTTIVNYPVGPYLY